ncbi:tetraacyldisaccharide 4'-kinase [Sphingobacterium spiritivorum]|uniref:tetraacyldisaccharide 4'-kinase n=1 Tax=Sphingobacterium spiritivorum TaxID=258 RepID=UPI003DA324C6
MLLLRWFLFPITIIYTSIIWLRNRLYDYQLLKSKTYNIPLIVIGNLAIGGTGKSPMTEFLIRLLKEKIKLATLSRGYGRKTKGFRFVSTHSTSAEAGDEPLQFKRKFPEITVAVCEDRCYGVEQLEDKHDLIILDDAFQHRKLKPTYSILLFEYTSLSGPVILLPTGNFRDMMMESHRANIIIVTKTPEDATEEDKRKIIRKISRHNSTASIYFSKIKYDKWMDKNGSGCYTNLKETDVLLITGIANPNPLINHLQPNVNRVIHMSYPDHHAFSETDISKIEEMYKAMTGSNKLILTTEKDFQRLYGTRLHHFPFYYIPIQIAFETSDHQHIERSIFDHLGL